MPDKAISPLCSLAIDLLPEFGWSIRGEPTYGPGSVFQGFVQISSSQPQQQQQCHIHADTIRLQFQAVEAIRPIEISPGVLRGRRHQPLFAVKQVLWKGDCLHLSSSSSESDASSCAFPFTIQIPVVQYPPSIDDHEYYQCSFKLIAIVEKAGQVLQSIEKKVSYRPYIETCLLKRPIESFSGQVKLHALEYVPGDTITAIIQCHGGGGGGGEYSSAAGSSSSSNSVTRSKRTKRIIVAKLYQFSMLRAVENVPKLSKVVASQSWEEDDASSSSSFSLDMLRIPTDVIPTFSYSSIMSVSYQLKVSVRQKKLGGLWTPGQDMEFPITIGTLGYGVHAPQQLKIYSTLSTEDRQEHVPRFMRAVEYSDSLPPYDSTRLPTYETVSS